MAYAMSFDQKRFTNNQLVALTNPINNVEYVAIVLYAHALACAGNNDIFKFYYKKYQKSYITTSLFIHYNMMTGTKRARGYTDPIPQRSTRDLNDFLDDYELATDKTAFFNDFKNNYLA